MVPNIAPLQTNLFKGSKDETVKMVLWPQDKKIISSKQKRHEARPTPYKFRIAINFSCSTHMSKIRMTTLQITSMNLIHGKVTQLCPGLFIYFYFNTESLFLHSSASWRPTSYIVRPSVDAHGRLLCWPTCLCL